MMYRYQSATTSLDRLARRIRVLVNRQFFNNVFSRLSAMEQRRLDELLDVENPRHKSDFNYLKETPKRATLSQMRDLQVRFSWFLTMGDVERLLEGIPNAKIRHFADEARSVDAAEMRQYIEPKSYTLLLAMIHQARVTACDNLVETFLKRIGAIYNKGKQALAELPLKRNPSVMQQMRDGINEYP